MDGVSPLCREAVGVFYSTNRLGKAKQGVHLFHKINKTRRHARKKCDLEDCVGVRKIIKRLKIFDPGKTKEPEEKSLYVTPFCALALC